MKIFILMFLLFTTIHAGQPIPSAIKLNNITKHVNSLKTTWSARNNFKADLSSTDIKYLLGAFIKKSKSIRTFDDAEDCKNIGLPKNFDAREKWPYCQNIGHIYDQGYCGSCWAVSTTTAFADRICIASNGKISIKRSSQQTLSCCYTCAQSNGCEGGWPLGAFDYFKKVGLVTGGDYNSTEGCQPYLQEACEHRSKGSLPSCANLPREKAPTCKLNCYNSEYKVNFQADRIKAKSYYEITPCAAMKEIYNNGPIVASFAVYEDFYAYKKGVYQHTTGAKTGYHAVRVIGWGEENNVPYWLAANSWNDHWGNKGFFKILRGNTDTLFDDYLMAVVPKLN